MQHVPKVYVTVLYYHLKINTLSMNNNLLFLNLNRYNFLRFEYNNCKHSKKCTFYTLRFGCSFAAVNTIKPQLL